MRTTAPLNHDLASLLKAAADRSGGPFKAGPSPQRALQTAASEWPLFDMGRPLVGLTKAMALADELDDRMQR